MSFRLGNLSVKEFAERVGTEFAESDVALLESHRSQIADFTDQTRFHIFDAPAISIDIGAVAMEQIMHIFIEAYERKPFNCQVLFYSPTVDPRTGETDGLNTQG